MCPAECDSTKARICRRKRYTSSREEEEVHAQICPCGKAVETITHIPVLIVGKCEMYNDGRDVLKEEIREKDDCGMEEFGILDSNDKTIVILGNRWWPQAAKQKEDKRSKKFLCNKLKQRDERPNVGGVSDRSRNVAPVSKGMRGQLSND